MHGSRRVSDGLAGGVNTTILAQNGSEMKANNLDTIDRFAELSDLLEAVESAQSASHLADLTEGVHGLGHKLCDSLASKAESD